MDLDDEELKATRKLNGLDDDLYKKEMEDRIEIGEYVRLARNQGINKIIDKKGDMYVLRENIINKYGDVENFLYEWELKKEIVKHRKQPIDLIECGDYVNGHLVTGKYIDVDEYGKDFWCLIIEDDSLLNRSIREENIQTILTKESYMANCYKVGGENG